MSKSGAGKPAGEPSQDGDLEKKSWSAAIHSFSLNKWMLAIAVLGLVVTAILGGVQACSSSGGTSVEGSGNNVAQNSSSPCGQVINGSCAVEIERSAERESTDEPDDAAYKKELAARSTALPRPPGPWPYVVIDTPPPGLLVRTTNEVEGGKLGLVPNRRVVWVDCTTTSTFTPPVVTGDNNIGPRWAQVRWSETTSASEAKAEKRGWMYLGGLVPFEHNGQVPGC
ncbi:hypothetical protein [Lentzea sp. NPDC059081]|uniref:hypothetical protein n=1 Tax=Lentzea sp. NPDC059081 TaxID=3346719 RepID=UPI00369C09AA